MAYLHTESREEFYFYWLKLRVVFKSIESVSIEKKQNKTKHPPNKQANKQQQTNKEKRKKKS